MISSPTLSPLRRDDVALLTVAVMDERDAGRPVRVVLDAGDAARHAVLVPLEVDDPVHALVAAAAVAHRDPALVVAAGPLRKRLKQRFLRLVGGDLVERGHRHLAAPR